MALHSSFSLDHRSLNSLSRLSLERESFLWFSELRYSIFALFEEEAM